MESFERLILASGSSGRRWLMNQAGYEFEVVVSAVSEPDSGFTNPRNMVQVVSWMKAYAVAVDQKKGTIIAADTIAWIDGQPLLKPQNREHARSMIELLQGRVHELWTGVVVWNRPSDEQICWQERSLVRVGPLENIQIEKYLDERVWSGCSGAYAIETNDDPIVQMIEGSLSNVVGLPMETLARVLSAIKN